MPTITPPRPNVEPIEILALGAGVQSSVLALMAARGEIFLVDGPVNDK